LNLSAFFDAKVLYFVPGAGGFAHYELTDDEKGDEPESTKGGTRPGNRQAKNLSLFIRTI
jgi:hypothetical protein